MSYRQTPSQTVGPFFAIALTAAQQGYGRNDLAGPNLLVEGLKGERIRIVGRVLDHDGRPVDDAMIELWQADAHGRYPHPADSRTERPLEPWFKGFGRADTGVDSRNRYIFDTIKPGSAEPGHAPHLNLIVFMRGLLAHVYTRVYFPDEADANAQDPVLAAVPAERRSTLIAGVRDEGGIKVYEHDIHMGGDRETVFFDV